MTAMTPAAKHEKLIFITHEYAPFRGGVATYVGEVAGAIHQLGGKVEVWAPDYGKCDFDGDGSFRVVRLRAGGSLRLGDQWQLMCEIRKRREEFADAELVLASVGAHLAFMILTWLGLIRCEQIVSLLHGSEVLRFERNPFWKFLASRFYRRVKRLITVSEFSRSLIKKSFLAGVIKKIELAPCACTSAAKRPVTSKRATDGKIRILTLARLHPRKGQLDTAQALVRLPAELRAQIIYQIGGGGDATYLERIKQECSANKVPLECLGEIQPHELANTYAQCDIFAMTSRILSNSVEGFGITYLDASYHGKPVIAYRSAGAMEAVVEDETGLLVTEGNLDALTKAFAFLISDANLRERLGAGGQAWAGKFDWQIAAKVFLQRQSNFS